MNKIIKQSFLILILTALLLFIPNKVNAEEKVTLHLFYSESCPHCAKEKEFLNTIKDDYPYLNIEMYEVSKNAENDAILTKVKKALDTENPYVPYTVIGSIGMTGYNENIKNQIIHFIEKYSKEKHKDIVTSIINGETIEPEENQTPYEEPVTEEENNAFHLPILGEIDAKKISLPILAIIIGTIDGFNPCAMWVLLFLISMLVGMKNKKRMWVLGLTFLCTSAFIYFLFMVSWLTIALSVTSIIWIRNLIAIVALLGGLWNLYNFFKHQDSGCTIVKEEKRKKVFTKIKNITKEKSFFLALIGIIVLAISVNIVELACSAGLPLIFTQILSLNNLPIWQYYVLILLYIIFFLLDDIIVFTIAMKTLEVTGFSTKYTKYSHLIGGIILVIIGILLLVNPGLLMFEL